MDVEKIKEAPAPQSVSPADATAIAGIVSGNPAEVLPLFRETFKK